MTARRVVTGRAWWPTPRSGCTSGTASSNEAHQVDDEVRAATSAREDREVALEHRGDRQVGERLTRCRPVDVRRRAGAVRAGVADGEVAATDRLGDRQVDHRRPGAPDGKLDHLIVVV